MAVTELANGGKWHRTGKAVSMGSAERGLGFQQVSDSSVAIHYTFLD